MRVSVAIAVACFVLIGLSVADESQASIRKQTSIPAQGLGPALQSLAKERNFQIVYVSEEISDRRTQGASGELTIGEALTRLLDGTGLSYRYLDENTITILPVSSASGSEADGPGSDSSRTPSAPQAFNSSETLDPGTAKKTGFWQRFRLAQNDQSSKTSDSGEQEVEPPQSSDKNYEGRVIDEVVVTGSHLRGNTEIGFGPIVMDKETLTEMGYATVQDAIKSLPQAFGGGVSEDVTTDTRAGNFNYGTGINLRGLGADATLVLLNGRRVASGGTNGAFVDVSAIPAAAIERIEILTDGASAIYGSDAIGGVVNIILRKDFSGAETRVRLGSLDGDAMENQFSQLFGLSWTAGNLLVGYHHYSRERLLRADRPYTASDDLTAFGGSDFRRFNSNPANILDLQARPAFAVPAGQDGTALTPADLLPGVVNFTSDAITGQSDLLPEQKVNAGFLSVRQELRENLELVADARYSLRDSETKRTARPLMLTVPASNAFFVDPFGGRPSVLVAYDFRDDLGPQVDSGRSEAFGGNLGLTFDFSRGWRSTLSASYGEDNTRSTTNTIDNAALQAALASPDPTTAFNPFGDGSHTSPQVLDAIGSVTSQYGGTRIWGASVLTDGPALELPGGTTRLAFGADYRNEELNVLGSAVLGVPLELGLDRHVSAVFAELAIPLAGQANGLPGLRGLDLSVAARYEDYSDFGNSFDPKFGIRWLPHSAIAIKGTWGTSFRAPRLIERLATRANTFDFFSNFADPQSPSGRSNVLVRFGNNPDLEPEAATTWAAGLEFRPQSLSGFDASLAYYAIKYKDRIGQGGPTGNAFSVLQQETLWAPIIDRSPTADQVAEICASPFFIGVCQTGLPAAVIDLRLRNLALVRTRGMDLDIHHVTMTGIGQISLGLRGNYVFDFERAVTEHASGTNVVDTVSNVQRFRGRGSLSWTRSAWTASSFLNFAKSYKDNITAPVRPVESYTTADLSLSYEVGADRGGWLGGIDVTVSAVNVFDKEPPFVNGPFAGYDVANADLYGRSLAIQVSKAW